MHKWNVTNSFLERRYLLWAMSLALLLMVSTGKADESSPAFILIAHHEQDIKGLSDLDVRRIFSGQKQQWSDGRKIKVFVLPTTSLEHRDFCRQLLKVFPYQLERIWNQLLYSGQGESPEVVPDVATMQDRVRITKGAIGYIPTTDVIHHHKDVDL